MITVTANPAVQEFLGHANGLTAIIGANGQLLGYYMPSEHKLAAEYVQAAAHFDPAETKRRAEAGEQGKTTQEVLDHLHSLERT